MAAQPFLPCLGLDVTANCICEIHSLELYGKNRNTVNKLSSQEIKIPADLNPQLVGVKQVSSLCAMQQPPPNGSTTLENVSFYLSSVPLRHPKNY